MNGVVNSFDKLNLWNTYGLTSVTKIYMWGNSEKSKSEWDRMNINDYIFILCSKDNHIVVLQITQKINSKVLSEQIWRDRSFSLIYILTKIKTIKENISKFLIEYCRYKPTIKNIQGNMILNKKKSTRINE